MPFLIPLIPAIVGAAGAGIGAVESIKSGNAQQHALNQQTNIAQQEEARKQAIYDQLQPFFSQYLKQGSPFLGQQQTASAQQTAQQYGNAAGQFRNQMQETGLGYGPSGATAAGLGGIATQAAGTGAGNYLQNLLNNEQVKFQAAQGISGLGQGSQINPTPSQYPINPISGAVGDFGKSLAALLKNIPGMGGGSSGGVGQLPVNPTNLPGIPSFGGAPSTGGVSGGWDGSE